MHWERERFVHLSDHGGLTLENVTLKRCIFEGCVFSGTKYVAERSRVAHLVLEDCKAINSGVHGGVVEECVVTNLQSKPPLICWGTVFRHVTLRGRICRLMISPYGDPTTEGAALQKEFEAANQAYYAGVDWALDIREAEFEEEADLRGVPIPLVRRDPDTQMIITRAKLMSGAWRRLDLVDRLLPLIIEHFLAEGEHSRLLVAAKRSNSFKTMLAGLQNLRAAGLAE